LWRSVNVTEFAHRSISRCHVIQKSQGTHLLHPLSFSSNIHLCPPQPAAYILTNTALHTKRELLE